MVNSLENQTLTQIPNKNLRQTLVLPQRSASVFVVDTPEPNAG